MQSCDDNGKGRHTDSIETDYSEQHRPQFHFTPKGNWMNDPNGLVYHNGQWHLFYQHNPYGNKWGHMSWGHAVTKDLIHWGHLPIALYEELNPGSKDSTMVYSGSAVIDKGNRSGLCPAETLDCMVAVYTSHVHRQSEPLVQHQSLAFSSDNGQTWTKYEGNPVLDLGEKDFRDPKVFWHPPSQKWIMAVALPEQYKVLFYGSPDLKNWQKLSEFGGVGDISKPWECPDLFELKVRNMPGVKKWVLLVSGGGPHEDDWGMQYFIGNFDGEKFTLSEGETGSHYLDYGKDFYAAQTWNDDPYRRRLLIGWLNNWAYAGDIPTSPWRSAQSLPRQLLLHQSEEGIRLIQFPFRDIRNLRAQYGAYDEINLPVDPVIFRNYAFKSAEIQVVLRPKRPNPAKQFGLKVFKSATDEKLEETLIGYDMEKEVLFIDRSLSGNVDFHERFSSRDEVPLKLKDDKVSLHVFIDHSIIEVFANGGEVVMSERVFPTMDQGRIELFSVGFGRAIADTFQVWELKSIWGE